MHLHERCWNAQPQTAFFILLASWDTIGLTSAVQLSPLHARAPPIPLALARSPSWESLRERSSICIIVFSAIVGGLSGKAAAATGRLGHLSRTNQATLCAATGLFPARSHIHMLMNKLIKYDLYGQKRANSLLMRAQRICYLCEYHDTLQYIISFIL